MVYDPLSLATDSGYVFLFITLYKNPYLDLVNILSGGWDNIFAGTSIFLLNPYNILSWKVSSILMCLSTVTLYWCKKICDELVGLCSGIE